MLFAMRTLAEAEPPTKGYKNFHIEWKEIGTVCAHAKKKMTEEACGKVLP